MSESQYDLEAAHKRSIYHREEVLTSETCGCFYCCHIFSPAEISEWTDENESGVEETALCPRCGIDSVIGSRSGYPIDAHFLGAMKARWFGLKE
jgi:hypothetical protein